jgi:hypothetical protein
MHEAEGIAVEAARLFGGRPLRPAEAMALEAAVDGAAGKLFIHAAPHHLHQIVEGQFELCAQLADEFLLEGREADGEPLGPMRAIGNGGAVSPAPDRGLADAKLDGKVRHGGGALLDVGPRLGRRGGIGMQSQLHLSWRSFKNRMPRCTLIPSRQSLGIKHGGGDQVNSAPCYCSSY